MTAYPSGRSAYRPGHARTDEATPQTDPDLFSVEDLKAEIAYLVSVDRRCGAHHLRALARVRLTNEILRRGAPGAGGGFGLAAGSRPESSHPVCSAHGARLVWWSGWVSAGWLCPVCLEPTCDVCEEPWPFCFCEKGDVR